MTDIAEAMEVQAIAPVILKQGSQTSCLKTHFNRGRQLINFFEFNVYYLCHKERVISGASRKSLVLSPHSRGDIKVGRGLLELISPIVPCLYIVYRRRRGITAQHGLC